MSGPASQTLDRGIRLLQHISAAQRPLAVNDVAQGMALHRSVVYRLLRTLAEHGLVERDELGRYGLGLGMTALARGVRADLQGAALPRLDALARELSMTAFLVARSGDECVTVLSVEPPHATAHVTHRPGNRHPVDRGAPGLALLMAGCPEPGERPEITAARIRGWAESTGEVLAGVRSIAAPVAGTDGGQGAAVAVVFVGEAVDTSRVGAVVASTGATIGAALRGL